MGKKGSWFSAIKRVFSHNSKEKLTDGSDKKSAKEKKKGKGILRHDETKSFIPLFRKPSSIEKILGEADQLFIRHPTSSEQPRPPPIVLGRPNSPRILSPQTTHRALSPKTSPPRVFSPRISSPKVQSPRAVSPKIARAVTSRATSSKGPPPKVNQSRKETSHAQRPEPTSRDKHLSATKIQAAYRGYLARKSFRALRGLVRLQGVVRGQNVKRQSMNAMKKMQLLVRVQTQIHSRRIQMLENEALQRQAYRNDKEAESTLSKWTLNQQQPEGGRDEDWDDSVLTKEEVETRSQRKVEAVMKRERAMAYAYSQQLWKANPKTAQSPLDIRSSGYPWWWNWLEWQLPASSNSQNQATMKNLSFTPPRPISDYRASPQLLARNYQETLTPRSSRSAIPIRAKQFHTPGRTPPQAMGIKYSKPRSSAANSAYDIPLKDDDSLISCPPFSGPNYMTPTVSAKAKVRANSNPRDGLIPGTPGNDSKRRFSFPLSPNIGSFKWNKGFNNDAASQRVMEKHQSSHSLGDAISVVDSTVSMPATVGRKPFNRFV